MPDSIKITILIATAFLVNIPLGYYRENYKRMSWQWLLVLHSSIPVIVLLRVGLDINLFFVYVILFSITSAVLGQLIGARPIRRYIQANYKKNQS
ncbi:MAG TPA: hypothetical protein ENI73_04140 [Spirochaetes bacterium]|nr:hypothetical protein [Spirochaetota bacterium]